MEAGSARTVTQSVDPSPPLAFHPHFVPSSAAELFFRSDVCYRRSFRFVRTNYSSRSDVLCRRSFLLVRTFPFPSVLVRTPGRFQGGSDHPFPEAELLVPDSFRADPGHPECGFQIGP